MSVPPEDFGSLQESCSTLRELRNKAISGEEEWTKDGSTFVYLRKDGILYRKCATSKHTSKNDKLTLVVPKNGLPIILSVAHDNSFGGSLFTSKGNHEDSRPDCLARYGGQHSGFLPIL